MIALPYTPDRMVRDTEMFLLVWLCWQLFNDFPEQLRRPFRIALIALALLPTAYQLEGLIW